MRIAFAGIMHLSEKNRHNGNFARPPFKHVLKPTVQLLHERADQIEKFPITHLPS